MAAQTPQRRLALLAAFGGVSQLLFALLNHQLWGLKVVAGVLGLLLAVFIVRQQNQQQQSGRDDL